MRHSIKALISIPLCLFLFWGCASKQEMQREIVVIDSQDGATRFRPIVGSRNSDSRVIINNGVLIKVWIAPYETDAGYLVSAHDMYFWATKRRFITGQSVPNGSRGVGATTPTNKLPFSLAPTEIDRSDIDNDSVILEFRDSSSNATNKGVLEKVRRGEEDYKNSRQSQMETETNLNGDEE